MFMQKLPYVTVLDSEEGITLVEVLVATVLLSVMAAAAITNLTMALWTAQLTEVNFAANSLAISKVEELSAVDVDLLDASYNSTENNVQWSDLNIAFTRTTTVTVNGDSSRTVNVNVATSGSKIPTSVQFNTTFALWE
ncbi:prepilin-type N-terminal cleavage/methylation domain-containing protein [bacterium]|nr:prepilin-type N-terminal cleavage/methylation domain-containing protein [bacterium]